MTSQPRPHAARTTLFCIPHAGGSAAFYTALAPHLPAEIDCRPLELAGRGRRHREPKHTCLEAMARDLLAHMAPLRGPYALFGHSMGALLALLCALNAREDDLPQPQALFLSSADAPVNWAQNRTPDLSALPPQALLARIADLGGLPDAIAASKDFLDYYEPILRADIIALESWAPGAIPPLPVPIVVFRGDDDIISEEAAREWRTLTTAEFELNTLPGGHFHLQHHWPTLAGRMAQVLTREPAFAPAP